MKNKQLFLLVSLLLSASVSLQAQEPRQPPVAEKGLDERINEAVAPAAKAISDVVFFPIPLGENASIPGVVAMLLICAIIFTVYFRFVNFTHFRLAIDTVRGKFSSKHDDGEVSHFQALTAALSATVGLGNIAGVAIAIAIGGPGATFWLIVAGFLGMSSKFVECTLGVKFRDVDADGTVHGGPMYYLSKGFAEKNMAGLGKVLAVFFAIMCIGGSFGGGNMFQANQATAQVVAKMGFESSSSGFYFGLFLAVLVGVVIIGGIKRIASVADKLVPIMSGLYIIAALIVIFANLPELPKAFALIFKGAFTPEGVEGGVFGVLVAGLRRAAFSNEAGVGSAPIAHSAVRTKYAASEGIVALLEPFIDTVVICTMTALVVIITGTYKGAEGIGGVAMTDQAFSSVIPFFSYILTITVFLFAYSTMLSWSYYGLQAWKFLFGRSLAADYSYKILFLIFIIIGSSSTLTAVVDFSDAMIFAMAFANLAGLLVLMPVVKTELAKYMDFVKTFDADTKKI